MPAFRPRRGLLSGAIATAFVAATVAPAAALAADATLDDRTLTRSPKGWSDAKESKAVSGTLSKAKKKGATLTAKTAATDGGSVVVQVAKGRGTFTVTVGGKKRATVVTSQSKKALKSFSFKGSGTVKLTATKLGGGVFIDAIKLKGVPQPSTGGPGTGTTPGTTPGTAPGATTPTPTPVPGGSLTPPSASPVNLGALTQVNTSAAGVAQDGSQVTNAVVSPSGKFVAFWARANNLVPGVTDDRMHVYIKNLATGAINVADKDQNGNLANGSPSDAAAAALTWKPDETEIAFASLGTNLGVPLGGANAPYLYSKDVVDGVPTGIPGLLGDRVSEAAWSPDGSKIAFSTTGDYCFNVAPGVGCSGGSSDTKIYSYDFGSGKHTPVSATASGVQPSTFPGGAYRFVWSPDSARIAFVSPWTSLVAGDTNVADDVFVKTLADRSIQRVSLGNSGAQSNGSSDQPVWSPDGTKIAFQSNGSNLTTGDNNSDTDVFVRDVAAGSTTAVSTGEDGGYKLFGSRTPRWSPDGTKIAFSSKSLDLVPGFLDTNQSEDVYVRTLATSKLQLVSVRPDGVQGSHGSNLWGVAGNSNGWIGNNKLIFRSAAVNFPTADGNGNAFQEDLFLKTLN